MADVTRVEIEQDAVGWVLRVVNPGMRAQEYRCATREQAQSLADVLAGTKSPSSTPRATQPSKLATPPAGRGKLATPAGGAKPPLKK